MFLITRITDPRLAERVCGSFSVFEKGAFAYAAYKGEDVLATAAFFTAPGGCCTLCGVDTGRRIDIPMIDGIARAAFNTQLKAGAKTARLGQGIPQEIQFALTKLGYRIGEEFSLAEFFARKHCST